jgi:hypothetical protein
MPVPGRIGKAVLVAGLALSVSIAAGAGHDRVDCPLRVSVVWTENTVVRTGCAAKACQPGFTGAGAANVEEAGSALGFEFGYRCSVAVRRSADGTSYRGRWKKAGLRLLLLLAKAGEREAYEECELRVAMRPGVYSLARGGVRLSAPLGPQAAEGGEAAGTTGAGISVAVASDPEAADIEVDGRFRGSTPSSIDLAPGVYPVVLRKPGFLPWERRLYLTGGTIRVRAELETVEAN